MSCGLGLEQRAGTKEQGTKNKDKTKYEIDRMPT